MTHLASETGSRCIQRQLEPQNSVVDFGRICYRAPGDIVGRSVPLSAAVSLYSRPLCQCLTDFPVDVFSSYLEHSKDTSLSTVNAASLRLPDITICGSADQIPLDLSPLDDSWTEWSSDDSHSNDSYSNGAIANLDWYPYDNGVGFVSLTTEEHGAISPESNVRCYAFKSTNHPVGTSGYSQVQLHRTHCKLLF